MSLSLRAATTAKLSVDRESGTIRGCAVITAGQTKPSAGDGSVLMVDETTLKQVADLINSKPVKVRLGHVELDGVSDDVGHRVAYCENARVDGDVVRADLRFLAATDTAALRIMSIVETDPTDIGLSISTTQFEAHPPEMALRVMSLDAVDLVAVPAGNPAGMLSAKRKGLHMSFTEEQLSFLRGVGLPEDAPAESIPAFIDGLTDEQKAAFNAIAGEPAPVPASDDAQQMSAATGGDNALVLAERKRAALIFGMAHKAGVDESIAIKHVTDGTPVAEFAPLTLAGRNPQAMQTTRTTITADLNADSITPAMSDAISLRLGAAPKTLHPRVDQFRGRSLIEMGRAWLSAAGVHDAQTMTSAALASKLMRSRGLALSMATGDFPHLLADALGKSLRNSYTEYPATWSAWCRQTTAPDFKQVKRNQLHSMPTPTEIPEGDEYRFVTLNESKEVYALKTYGNGARLTRQMLINDDLSAFDRLPQMAAAGCRRLEDDLVYAVLTGNQIMSEDNVALFATAHSNIGSGAISSTTVSTGRQKMAKQTDLIGSTLNIRPATLLVPVALEDSARQLVAAQEVRQTGSTDASYVTNNYSFLQSLDVVAEPRLDADSTTQWYLAASPQQVDTVELCFLEGEETPVVEEEDEFTTDVRNFKVRHNAAARAIDFRGLYRSSGS